MSLIFRFLALVVVLFVACSSPIDSSVQKSVFRYNEPGGVTSLDPAFCRNTENIWCVNMVYNSLVELDQDLNPAPSLAQNWSISENGKSYFFDLRTDVLFHENSCFQPQKTRKLIANDVVFSLNRLVNPKTASPGAWVMDQVEKDQNTGSLAIKALNDSLIEIKLTKPFPAFLSLLAMQYCSIIPEEAVKLYGNEFARNPVGTGPFKLFLWDDGIKMILHKNEAYFEKDLENDQLPYLDAVSISFLKDKNANFLSMLKGDFDFLSGLDASYKDELLDRKGFLNPKFKNQFTLQKTPFLKSDYIGIYLDSTSNNPLQNKLVRKALNLAIDREELIKYLRNNIGVSAAQGFVPSDLLKSRPLNVGYPFNLSESKKLMTIAGFRNGMGFPSITIATTAAGTEICEYLQSQWQQIGIHVKVEVVPEANHREGVANGNYGLFRKNWVADYPDALNFYSIFYSSNFSPTGANYCHFNNDRFDQLYEKAMLCGMDDERNNLLLEMDEIIREEAPVIPLFYDEAIRLVSKNITGLPTNALNLLDLKRVRIINKLPT